VVRVAGLVVRGRNSLEIVAGLNPRSRFGVGFAFRAVSDRGGGLAPRLTWCAFKRKKGRVVRDGGIFKLCEFWLFELEFERIENV